MEEVVERVARALCARHYAERFGKPADDPHVSANVEANWNSWEADARTAFAAMESYVEEERDQARADALDQVRWDADEV